MQSWTTPVSFILYEHFSLQKPSSSNLQKTWLVYICVFCHSRGFLMFFKLCTSKFFHGKNHRYVLVCLHLCYLSANNLQHYCDTCLSWKRKDSLCTIRYSQIKKKRKRSRARSFSFTESALGALLPRQVQVTGMLSLQKVIRLHDLLCV